MHSSFNIDNIKEDVVDYLVEKTHLTREMAEAATEISRSHGRFDFTIQLAKVVHAMDKQLDTNLALCKDEFVQEITQTGLCYNIKINKHKYCARIYESIANSMLFDSEIELTEGYYYGSNNIGAKKTVVVDFSSPNIAKRFHAGHLRTTVLGNFISNIYKFLGYKVVRINHLGDWGKQFGLVGVGYKRYGSEEELKKDAIRHLLDVYIKVNNDIHNENKIINDNLVDDTQNNAYTQEKQSRSSTKTDQEAKQYFTLLEQGDEEKVKQWQQFRALSIEKYKELYSTLNIRFDVYGGESLYAKVGLEVIHDAKIDDDGSMFYDLKELGKFVVRKNDGSTLYSTRDIAAAIDREQTYHPTKLIYVVASQQELYFKQLFSVLRGEYGIDRKIAQNIELEHISFGMVNGLSTRKGNLVFLEDIINEAKDVMRLVMVKNEDKYKEIENVDETCTKLATAAMTIQDFNAKRIKNYTFDMKRNTNCEGETGPYLQYTHCRLVSIKRKNSTITPNMKVGLLPDNAQNLIFYLSKFNTVVYDSFATSEPCKLVTYLMKLSKQVNSLFSIMRVFGEEKETAEARLSVFEASRIILYNGLRILGIMPLDRM